jgi:hypothetical protein
MIYYRGARSMAEVWLSVTTDTLLEPVAEPFYVGVGSVGLGHTIGGEVE